MHERMHPYTRTRVRILDLSWTKGLTNVQLARNVHIKPFSIQYTGAREERSFVVRWVVKSILRDGPMMDFMKVNK